LNKLEDSSGKPVQAVESGSNSGSSPACGPVPLATRPADDYGFGSPVTFPGEW